MLKLKRKKKLSLVPKAPVTVVNTVPSDPLQMVEGVGETRVLLDAIIKRGDDIQSLCHDHVSEHPNKDFIMSSDYSVENLLMEFNDGGKSTLSRFALGQLCNKVGVPSQYVQKCLKQGYSELAAENLNKWLEMYDRPLFLRGYGVRHLRGVLSNKYSVCDTPQILDGICASLPVDEYNIKGWFMNEEFFHCRFVHKDRIDIEGEDLYPGISIESSDVGKSNLNVSFFVWKKVCTNGLIVPKKFGVLFSQKHIGLTSQQFGLELMQSFNLIEPVVDRVRESIEKTAGKRLDSAFSDEDSMNMLILRVKDLCSMGEEQSKRVISLMELGVYDKTQWGLANSITQVAQEYSMERRLELERAAGTLLVA